jgi:hypothetical protein
MPDLKYLYRVLYILINCFFKQIVDIFFNKDYYQESNILIIAYSNVVTVAEWLDGSFESQIRLVNAQQWFDTRNSHNMNYKFLSLKQ